MSWWIISSLLLGIAVIFLCWPLLSVPQAAKGKRLQMALLITVFLCGASLLFYRQLGAVSMLEPIRTSQAMHAELRGALYKASQAVSTKKATAQDWANLGALLLQAGQAEKSANAYKQATLLSQGAPEIILGYAQALFVATRAAPTQHALETIRMAHQLLPDHPIATMLARWAAKQTPLTTGNE